MITLLVSILVLLSLGLVIAVPVALATPSEWESGKDQIIKGLQLWAIIVVFIAIGDGLSSI